MLLATRARPVRLTGGLVSCVVATTSYTLWILSTGRKARIVKLCGFNHYTANVTLQIGYQTNAAVPVFTPVRPDILLSAGIDFNYTDEELLICGNAPDGFVLDSTANTGTNGNIVCQVSAAAASPNEVQVQVEVEEL